VARRLHAVGQVLKGGTEMKTKLMAMALLAGGSLFAAPRLAIGVGIGVPIAPAPVVVAAPAYIPPCPGPGYVWIGGNWIFRGGPVVRPGYFHAPIDHGRELRHR
jgi:hypothetical protein